MGDPGLTGPHGYNGRPGGRGPKGEEGDAGLGIYLLLRNYSYNKDVDVQTLVRSKLIKSFTNVF